MELIALILLLIPLGFPILGGLMAKSFGRNFWVWFAISCFLPFISCFIIVCLPYKKREAKKLRLPVQNEELFDHLFEEQEQKMQRA